MSQRPHPLDHLLHQHLRAFLQEADVAALRVLQRELEWVELPAGSVLMRQGEPGDAMYVLASGRLRVNITLADGSERTVRECTRGQVVGEMALITEEPRSATLVAVRDSVLARLAKPAFAELLRQHPAVSMVLTRQIIKRLQTEGQTTRLDRPVAIALLPLGGRLDGPTAAALAQGLVAELSQHGRVALIDSAAITARLGHAPGDDAASMRRVAVALDEIEASHDTLLLLADPAPTAWTRCCARQGDEVLLLAHADDDPAPGAVEQACGFGADGPQTLPATVLVLLHPAPRKGPTGTARWLAPRHLRAHVHLREGHAPDLARLARLVGRRGVGLVLAGGGARGACGRLPGADGARRAGGRHRRHEHGRRVRGADGLRPCGPGGRGALRCALRGQPHGRFHRPAAAVHHQGPAPARHDGTHRTRVRRRPAWTSPTSGSRTSPSSATTRAPPSR